MLLSGNEIKRQIELGAIEITPFDEKSLNPNSYDVTLADKLKVYDLDRLEDGTLDYAKLNETREIQIPKTGFVLRPNTLYLGSTVERTWSDEFVPGIDGRSSTARLGIMVHLTAGFGDAGFNGVWTFEIVVIHPVRIYPGIKVGQVYFEPIYGLRPTLYSGKYQHQDGAIASRSYYETSK